MSNPWESDPWKKMGVNPNATTKLQQKHQSEISKCKYCGRSFKLIEMINSYTCIDCYEKINRKKRE